MSFGYVLLLRERNFVRFSLKFITVVFTNIQHTKLYTFENLTLQNLASIVGGIGDQISSSTLFSDNDEKVLYLFQNCILFDSFVIL